MKETIAEQCFKLYGKNLQPEDITDCDGCRAATGRIFSGCLICGIRKCASKKNIVNCAYCKDYACMILKEHFILDPDAEMKLEAIRNTR
jgi:hypothetical protein